MYIFISLNNYYSNDCFLPTNCFQKRMKEFQMINYAVYMSKHVVRLNADVILLKFLKLAV